MNNLWSPSRREFLKFMGISSAQIALLNQLTACSSTGPLSTSPLPFTPLKPTRTDALSLVNGLEYDVLIEWNETLNEKGESFGYNNDYTHFFKLDGMEEDEALLWVNHESPHVFLQYGHDYKKPKTKDLALKELMSVGGSLIKIKLNPKTKKWQFVKNDPFNFRLDGTTPIPFIAPRAIQGKKVAMGTLANCSGGFTPWNTILTCEENYDDIFGEIFYDENNSPKRIKSHKFSRLEKFYPHNHPEHYGWVVEVDPKQKTAKKLTALGRFAHECATTTKAKDGRCVVYMGDDTANECLYKFIADKPNSLESGTLYVANTVDGKWVPLTRESHPKLKTRFKDQLDLLIRTREAARMVGGTPLNRPEDVTVDPKTNNVFVAQTNNESKKDYYGSILKIEEHNQDPLALTFKPSTYIEGGRESGLVCPDNFALDKKGNIWITNDVSETKIEKGPYKGFGNNGLFYVPLSGPQAGQCFLVASAPMDAEFTGPSFSEDGKTLFLSVQHPGKSSYQEGRLTSHWPHGGDKIPSPAVVTISGPTLDKLMS